MNSKFSTMKSIVVAVALAAGVSGMARADDSSMNRFTGDSYAYFNGGQNGNPVFNNAPSAWRQANPNGLSERVLQSYSSPGEAWHLNRPVFDDAPSTFAQTHPHGLSEREYQAMSSEAPTWQSPTQSTTTALASTHETGATKSAANEPLGTRIAKLFHVSPVGDAASTN